MATTKSGIKINPANKGKLHATLGVPKGKKIPVAQLQKAAHSSNPKTRQRAQFALNARKWNH
jgi:oligoendopeptidase F